MADADTPLDAELDRVQAAAAAKAALERFLSDLRETIRRRGRSDLEPAIEDLAGRLAYHQEAGDLALRELLRVAQEADSDSKSAERSEVAPRMETLLTFTALEMKFSKEAGDRIHVSVDHLNAALVELEESDPELRRLVEVVLRRAGRCRTNIENLERVLSDLQRHMKTRYGVTLE